MRRLPTIALALAMALAVAACAGDPSPAPSSAPPVAVAPGYAIACWAVPAAACERTAAEAVARLPAGQRPVVVVDVHDTLVDVESADGGGRLLVRYGIAADGLLDFGDWVESQVGAIESTSGPAGGPIVAFTLGHCGVSSPIDIDGSFWDAYGAIDTRGALLNASEGQFRRLGPDEAEFVTVGSRVSLRRHAGAKSPPGCD
jgi:hypothetical protein